MLVFRPTRSTKVLRAGVQDYLVKDSMHKSDFMQAVISLSVQEAFFAL